jgi:hypothetical protein
MKGNFGENFLPWSSVGKPFFTRSPDEIKSLILQSDEVKDVIASLVRERAKQYEVRL